MMKNLNIKLEEENSLLHLLTAYGTDRADTVIDLILIVVLLHHRYHLLL